VVAWAACSEGPVAPPEIFFPIVPIGDAYPAGIGGEAKAESSATELTGLDIPERCGDLYWLVSPF
jgi:hypothetical protein